MAKTFDELVSRTMSKASRERAAKRTKILLKPDAAGNVDAVQYARASIAREIIARRRAAGITQTELAKAAGMRVETLNRIENARHTADVATIAKIDAALPAREQAGAATGVGARRARESYGRKPRSPKPS